MSSKLDWAQPRFWLAALVGSALVLGACAEDVPTTPVKGGDKSPASSDDDDEGKTTSTDGDDEKDSEADAGKKPAKIDAGTTKPKPDAAVLDAKAPSDTTKKPDAGAEPVDVPTDGSTPSTATGDSGKEGGSAHEDLGKGDGKDVIAIGDSWMSLVGTGIQQSLVKASKQPYRTYGVAGTLLLNGQIPDQYASAKRADPDIKTVVMTGGGNDILIAGGDPKTTIPKIADRLDMLWTEMGKDGVQDVVYIEYSEGGNNGDNVRMGIAAVGPVCMNHKAVRCHFVLSDPIIMKMLRDGIHPTDSGYDKIGKAVFDLMVSEGMRR